jgi:hypothetical protein
MNVDLTDNWNWWDVIEVPVAELRERYHVGPVNA